MCMCMHITTSSCSGLLGLLLSLLGLRGVILGVDELFSRAGATHQVPTAATVMASGDEAEGVRTQHTAAGRACAARHFMYV